MIGAVLKTVVRSRVPWVRIPPPPPFKHLTNIEVQVFFNIYSVHCVYTNHFELILLIIQFEKMYQVKREFLYVGVETPTYLLAVWEIVSDKIRILLLDC